MSVHDIPIVSPFDNPELARELTEEEVVGEAPRYEVGPTSFKLPGGWKDFDGVLHKDVLVRELTGRDEEEIQKIYFGKAMTDALWARVSDTIVERGLVSIDGIPATQAMRWSLGIGDFDAVLLYVRYATWGTDYEVVIRCPQCKDVDTILELAKDLQWTELTDPYTPIKVRLRRGELATMRPSVASDRMAIMGTTGITAAEANTKALGLCLQDIDGRDMLTIPGGAEQYVRDHMGMGDRKLLIDALTKSQYGPNLREVVVPCLNCGRLITGPLDMAGLFFL